MIFFIKFIYSFLPIVLFYGLIKAIYTKHNTSNKIQNSFLIIFVSVIIGMIIQKVATQILYDIEAINSLRFLAIFSILIFILSIKFTKKLIIFYIISICLFIFAGADFVNTTKDFAISSTNVINSGLIINVALIFLATILIFFFTIAISKFSNTLSNKKIFYSFFILCSFTIIIDLIAKIMLFLLRKDILELTSTRLSFVAKVIHFDYLFIYLYILTLCLFLFIFYLNHKNEKIKQDLKSSLRRKCEHKILLQKRWLSGTIVSIFFLSSFLLYYDLYASLPIKISTATILKPDANDNFVIDLKEVSDGELYRYAYITQDGRKIRFFLINRYPDQKKVTAVFDACMICGDLGYIKKDNHVVCVACDVRIFIPSIGKAGGCNPIPLVFTKKDGKLIISKNEIISGATYFSEIVEIEVVDIISGAKLLNTKAEFSYTFKGKTFYFTSEQNMETFKNDPEEYAKNVVTRKWRTQGHTLIKGED